MKAASRSAQFIAYETIRKKIINGAFPGGMKLVEVQLAEDIGVSRTPIREAIRRLEQEGLIKRNKVFKPSEKDFQDMFEMRMLIESHAAKVAATNMPEERISKLRKSIQLAQTSEPQIIVEANKQFHNLIIKECQNPTWRVHSIKCSRIFTCAVRQWRFTPRRYCFKSMSKSVMQLNNDSLNWQVC